MPPFAKIMVFIFVLLSTAWSANYPVSNALDISDAMKIAQPGDTLMMVQGVWTDQRIIFQGNGNEDNPIVLKAEKPGFVILNGTSSLRFGGTFLEANGLHFVGGYSRSGAPIEFRNGSSKPAHNCRLTNSAIIDYNPPSNSTDYKWLSLYGTHNRVDHCFFEGKTHSGTTLVVWLDGQPNYHLIDYNYFGHRPELGVNGGETIRVGTSDWSLTDSYTTVEYNYFEQCNGETEIISNKSCENIYRYNTFFDNEGTLTLRHGNRCTVEGNFFLGNNNYDAGGVRIIGEDHKVFNNYFYQLSGSGYRSALCMVLGVPNSPLNRYYQVKRALVAFNTFVDCRNTFTIGYGSSDDQSLTPVDCKIANNIVVSDDDIIQYETDPLNMMYAGNIFNGDLGISLPPGITMADPKLVLEGELWRLSPESPAIDAAVDTWDFLVDDMDGQIRTDAFDVGADERNKLPIFRWPLGPNTTGPSWLNEIDIPIILTLHKEGEGEVSVDPPGGIYNVGAVVTLAALPDSGWKFSRWSGDVESTQNPLTLDMDASKTIKCIFEIDGPALHAVNVYVFSGGGIVELNPPGPTFFEGSKIIMTAIPDEGWQFKNWGGDLSGDQNPDTILVDSDKSITATFARIPASVASTSLPTQFELRQNFPNPFNPITTIEYSLPQPSYVRLAVYNSLGRRIVTLKSEQQPIGEYSIEWSGRSDDGRLVDSGLYLYRLEASGFVETKKMMFIQ